MASTHFTVRRLIPFRFWSAKTASSRKFYHTNDDNCANNNFDYNLHYNLDNYNDATNHFENWWNGQLSSEWSLQTWRCYWLWLFWPRNLRPLFTNSWKAYWWSRYRLLRMEKVHPVYNRSPWVSLIIVTKRLNSFQGDTCLYIQYCFGHLWWVHLAKMPICLFKRFVMKINF